jgi:hypothetical protein
MNRLMVFEKRVLRGTFGPNRDGTIGGRTNCIARSFITFDHLAKCYYDDQYDELDTWGM